MNDNSLWSRIWMIWKREFRNLTSRPLYLFGMVIAPLFTVFFFLTLMGDGLPTGLPIAVVDLDNSTTSRKLVRQLDAFKQTEVVMRACNFSEARQAMQEGKVYGIYLIPKDMGKDVMANRQPKVSFYLNNSYLVAGSLLYRDLKTISVLGSAAVGREFRKAKGQSERQAMIDLQPIAVDAHLLGNPLANYSVYLCNTILPGVYNILIMLLTIYAMGSELKKNTSHSLLRISQGNLFLGLLSKLAPHALIYFLVITAIDVILYCYLGYPCKSGLLSMLAASYMLVLASMAMSIFLFGLFPVMRLSMSCASLISVVSLSISGFSFPVTEMHYLMKTWSNVFPLRHFFLIYVDQALSGLGFAYTWPSYLALTLFLFLPLFVMPRLKMIYENFKYVP
ncbi:MAG: ABC transporter permease [Paludibacteraceae bacterium]|nr:ABC transporter permease [Paludibacteraceae bacterium]